MKKLSTQVAKNTLDKMPYVQQKKRQAAQAAEAARQSAERKERLDLYRIIYASGAKNVYENALKFRFKYTDRSVAQKDVKIMKEEGIHLNYPVIFGASFDDNDFPKKGLTHVTFHCINANGEYYQFTRTYKSDINGFVSGPSFEATFIIKK